MVNNDMQNWKEIKTIQVSLFDKSIALSAIYYSHESIFFLSTAVNVHVSEAAEELWQLKIFHNKDQIRAVER